MRASMLLRSAAKGKGPNLMPSEVYPLLICMGGVGLFACYRLFSNYMGDEVRAGHQGQDTAHHHHPVSDPRAVLSTRQDLTVKGHTAFFCSVPALDTEEGQRGRMYHLAKGIYANLTRQEEYSVLILGLDNAGKTTLLEQLKHRYSLKQRSQAKGADPGTVNLQGARILPTVGQNVGRIKYDKVLLKLWDLGGQESLRTLWDRYFYDAHAVVFVVDSTDRARIEECRDELEHIIGSDVMEGTPVLMLANKQDRDDCMEVEDIKEIFNKIAQKMGARDSRVLPISALDGTGVADATEWLVSRLERNKKFCPPNLV